MERRRPMERVAVLAAALGTAASPVLTQDQICEEAGDMPRTSGIQFDMLPSAKEMTTEQSCLVVSILNDNERNDSVKKARIEEGLDLNE
jgi:deoxyxylulose-5-phosphate synthase